MNYGRAVLFGLIAGFAGAALWAAISYYANYEIGWLAWGIGLAVGWATVQGAKGGSPFVGVLAVLITVFALVLGKMATVELVMNDDFGDPEVLIQESIAGLNEEVLSSYLADEHIANREQDGEVIAWPAGVDPFEAATEADYPAEIWGAASAEWQGFSDQQRLDYRASIEENIRSNLNENFGVFQEAMRKEGFIQSFSGMDLLFFGLAICTAFSVGKSGGIESDSSENKSDEQTHGEGDELA